MIVRITPAQQAALADAQLRTLGRRITVQLAPICPPERRGGLPEQVDRWLSEGLQAGIETEMDLAQLCIVLFDIDQRGKRPPSVVARLADPDVGGELKVFQVRHAWTQISGGV